MGTDKVLEIWLERQLDEVLALAEASDTMNLASEAGTHPPRRFVARFASPTLVREGTEIKRADGFAVLFQFPSQYLRVRCDPAQVVNLLGPDNTFHPNVSPPFVCIGPIAPGTGLVELIYQVHEIMTFNKLTPRENDALNRDACAWARRHMQLFPLTTAPLRRSNTGFSVAEMPSKEPRDGPRSV